MSKPEEQQQPLGVIDITLVDADGDTYIFTASVLEDALGKLKVKPLTGSVDSISEHVELSATPVDAPISPQEQLVDLDVIAIEADIFSKAYIAMVNADGGLANATEYAKDAVKAFRELYEPSLDD